MKRTINITGLKGPSILAAAVSLASCSASGSNPQSVTVQSPLSGALQMAVGTANIYGDDTTGLAKTGTNVVVTYRQPSGGTEPGGTAALVNSPTLTGPWTLPTTTGTANGFGSTLLVGPSTTEAGGNAITSTAQQNPGTPNASIPVSSFGVSTGATGLGLEPFNYSANGGSTGTGSGSVNFGAPDSYVPYYVPVYDPLGSKDANRARPWGGPPAFDPDKNGKGTRDGSGFPAAVLGEEEGIDVFEGAGPTAGAYTLSVNVPTSASTTGTTTTTATLSSTALLPAVSYLTLTPTFDGNGGGTFPAVLPAGVTGEYLQIRDFGPTTSNSVSGGQDASCNGSTATAPVYYTIYANATGNYTLPDFSGPGLPGSKTPTLCTDAQNQAVNPAKSRGATDPATDGDSFTVQVYGFDYPAYQASYPQSLGNPKPVLTGANGQADITISSAAGFTQPTTVAMNAGAVRMSRAQLTALLSKASI